MDATSLEAEIASIGRPSSKMAVGYVPRSPTTCAECQAYSRRFGWLVGHQARRGDGKNSAGWFEFVGMS